MNSNQVTDRGRGGVREVSIPLLLRTHYELQKGLFFSGWKQVGDRICVWSEVSSVPMWNHAALLDAGPPDSLFAFAKEHWPENSRRPVVYVVSSAGAAVPSAWAPHPGYERCDQESWMVYDGSLENQAQPSELEFHLVQDGQRMADFREIFFAAYQTKGSQYDKLFRQEPVSGDKHIHHYVGYAAGRPVCIGSLISNRDGACIYNVGTDPAARQRGYAAQLMAHLVAKASEFGDEVLFLQAEKGSKAERLYLRLGFRVAFVRTGYRATGWSPKPQPAPGGASKLGSALFEAVGRDRIAEATGRRQATVVIPYLPGFSRAMVRFAADSALTPATIWIGAWAALLSRYTREEHVSFGVRTDEKPLGSVTNLDYVGDAPVSVWLSRIAPTVDSGPAVAAQNESTTSFETVLDLRADAEHAVDGDLNVLMEGRVNSSDGGSFQITFDAARVEERVVRRLAEHLFNLISGFIARPQSALADLEIVGATERDELLRDWSVPAHDEAESMLVTTAFERQVLLNPAQPALELASERPGESGPSSLTYTQLNEQANQLACRLRRLGVGEEVLVAVCLERSLDFVISLLAILKVGGVCLPMDAASPPERMELVLADAQPRLVLGHERILKTFSAGSIPVFALDAERAGLAGESKENLPRTASWESAAYVIYTSGSTGKPKGVVISNRAIALHCQDAVSYYGLKAEDRVLQFNSFSFDAAFEQILATLTCGGTLVVRGPAVWNTSEFRDHADAHALTVVDLPTAYWHQLLDAWVRHPEEQPRCLPRLFIVGGEAMMPQSLELWRKLPLGQARLINAYGPTETTITATAFEIKGHEPSELPRVPIGRARGARRLCILDAHGRLVPKGIPGELHIGGPCLARGYLNRPDLTREKFIPDPFEEAKEERLYRTGDLVRLRSDDQFEFLGRIDQQIKLRGYRIELGEIESVLRQHPGVQDAAVTLSESSGDERFLAVYYVLRPGQSVTHEELRGFLRRKLPEYMVPIGFLRLEELPLLPSGKVDRRALAAVVPEAVSSGTTGPRDPMELRIQLLFERILQRTGIGVDVSLFELGGDSLQALELIVELERIAGRDIPMETLYQNATVESLAKLLRDGTGRAAWSSLVPLQTGGNRLPLFLVHTTPGDILGYGNLIYHLDADQPCYGFQSLGLFEKELSHSQVEAMAAYYVQLLRQQFPQGPYCLGGWCYGGMVAVEMAQQLLAAGEKVAFLGLLETVAPPPPLRIYRYYLHRLRCFLKLGPRQWLSYFRSKIAYSRHVRVANKMRFSRLQKHDKDSAAVEEHNRRLAQLEHVYAANLRALKIYRPRPYLGKVTLFNAEQTDPGVIPDPLYAWVGLAAEIETHLVPGDHDSMLTEPNVQVLARKLEACLARVQEERLDQSSSETGASRDDLERSLALS